MDQPTRHQGFQKLRSVEKKVKPDPRARSKRDRSRFHWSETRFVRALNRSVPWYYKLYMGFVNATSRHTEIHQQSTWDRTDRGESIVAAVLHEDVFFVGDMAKDRWTVTMASFAQAGAAIAYVLEAARFVTFRGSPRTSGRDRGGREAAEHIVRYLASSPSAMLIGITVDGSRGPARRVKPGVVFMAAATGKALYVQRTYAKRHLRLRSWDRSYIPLPFNHIVSMCDGPFVVPPDPTPRDLKRLRAEIQEALLRLADDSIRFFDQDPARINGADATARRAPRASLRTQGVESDGV